MEMFTPAAGQGQVVFIHDCLGRADSDRAHRDQRMRGCVQWRVVGVAVSARAVQQRALSGQPQVQFRAGLRHPLMLSRVPGGLGSVPVTRGPWVPG